MSFCLINTHNVSSCSNSLLDDNMFTWSEWHMLTITVHYIPVVMWNNICSPLLCFISLWLYEIIYVHHYCALYPCGYMEWYMFTITMLYIPVAIWNDICSALLCFISLWLYGMIYVHHYCALYPCGYMEWYMFTITVLYIPIAIWQHICSPSLCFISLWLYHIWQDICSQLLCFISLMAIWNDICWQLLCFISLVAIWNDICWQLLCFISLMAIWNDICSQLLCFISRWPYGRIYALYPCDSLSPPPPHILVMELFMNTDEAPDCSLIVRLFSTSSMLWSSNNCWQACITTKIHKNHDSLLPWKLHRVWP